MWRCAIGFGSAPWPCACAGRASRAFCPRKGFAEPTGNRRWTWKATRPSAHCGRRATIRSPGDEMLHPIAPARPQFIPSSRSCPSTNLFQYKAGSRPGLPGASIKLAPLFSCFPPVVEPMVTTAIKSSNRTANTRWPTGLSSERGHAGVRLNGLPSRLMSFMSVSIRSKDCNKHPIIGMMKCE